MSAIKDDALVLHHSGSNCAQSVLCSFSGALRFDARTAHRLATGLGAGLGRRQSVCGAVTGGAMAIGAALGNDDGSDLEAKEACYAAVKDFVARIEAEFGSIECRALLGVDLNTEEGKAGYKARGLSASVCDKAIARASELAWDIIRAAPRAQR